MMFTNVLAGTFFAAVALAAPGYHHGHHHSHHHNHHHGHHHGHHGHGHGHGHHGHSVNHNRFTKVPLCEPLNWIAGPSLFPHDVIEGFTAQAHEYDYDTWSKYVLEKCKCHIETTSTLAFSAESSGSHKDRVWFGYCFRGGATTPANYVRDPEGCVRDSVAYTCVHRHHGHHHGNHYGHGHHGHGHGHGHHGHGY